MTHTKPEIKTQLQRWTNYKESFKEEKLYDDFNSAWWS